LTSRKEGRKEEIKGDKIEETKIDKIKRMKDCDKIERKKRDKIKEERFFLRNTTQSHQTNCSKFKITLLLLSQENCS